MLAEENRPRRRRKGTERAKAWIYSVLNPLMEDLRAENTLLAKKNITWRYQTAEMEFIRQTRELISPSARPNYDDLLRGRPDLRPPMEGRDTKVEALNQAALDCWKHLTQHGRFQSIVEKQLKQWTEERNPYPGGAVPNGEFWLQVAEYVVNNIEELPYHYTSSAFWSRFRQIFLAQRPGPFLTQTFQPIEEGLGTSPSFSRLDKSIIELRRSNEDLIETLDQVRSNLCTEYDIPAAPI